MRLFKISYVGREKKTEKGFKKNRIYALLRKLMLLLLCYIGLFAFVSFALNVEVNFSI